MDKPAAKPDKPPTRSLSRKTKIRIGIFSALAIVVPALSFVLYVLLRLHLSYSDGDRSGTLQKFSRKGWICKTYEGELTIPGPNPGTLAQPWPFTVRDDEIAKQINAAIGHRVVVHYEQHPDVPTTCFGETEYYVDGVRIVD